MTSIGETYPVVFEVDESKYGVECPYAGHCKLRGQGRREAALAHSQCPGIGAANQSSNRVTKETSVVCNYELGYNVYLANFWFGKL